MTLTDFLLARIAEDEAAARDIPEGSWDDACDTTRRYDHVFRWSPARVLAECEAKRRIVELHAIDCYVGTGSDGDDDYFCSGCPAPGGPHPDDVECPTLRLLALPYADHPDYLPEWSI